MKKTILFLGCLCICLALSPAFAQTKDACIDEVLSYETMGKPEADSVSSTGTYFSYALRVTNWDDEITLSNIKMYKKGKYMNFFSEQATIYTDENEVMIIMPEQKVIIINSIDKEKKSAINDNFYELRKEFIDSCDVVKCEAKNATTKILVLKARQQGLLAIEDMTYEYNPVEKKIISIKINYAKNYKLKQMVMIYKEYDGASTYKFSAVKKYYSDRHGNVNDTYKGFEIVDNREKKKSTRK